MNKVLVAFALKEELTPWRRRRRFSRRLQVPYDVLVTSSGTTEIYVTLVGAGAPQRENVKVLTKFLEPSLGIVTGVAAGLTPEWQSGDLLVARSVVGRDGADEISSPSNLIEFAAQCGAKTAAKLVNVPRVVRTVAEKEQLAALGEVADMESLPLMRQWSLSGIPCLALRVILDPMEMPMVCDFEAAMDAHGQIRITHLLGQLARRPQLLPHFVNLARRSRHALANLSRFLDRFFERLQGASLNLDLPPPARALPIDRPMV